MPRETPEQMREELEEYEIGLRNALDLSHAVVLLLRGRGTLEADDIAAVLQVAELAESCARTVYGDWDIFARELRAAGMPEPSTEH